MSRLFFAKRNLIGSKCNSFSAFTLANIVQLAFFKFAQFQEARNTYVDMHKYVHIILEVKVLIDDIARGAYIHTFVCLYNRY